MTETPAAARGPEILFSDASIVVCVKPAGLDSQRALPELLTETLGGSAYCVHRLDREVGGVMVYARTRDAAAALSRAITAGVLEKEYLAVCEGTPAPPTGEMRDLLFHDPAKNKSYVVKRLRRGVREALLAYTLVESLPALSLVRVRLYTGRTHQIRVQFASRGLPLSGDARYGAKTRGGIALWSHTLRFPHPVSGETLSFTVPTPDAPPWTRFSQENAR
jgi:23S rRNA pseudouridine1911/1915/1917 synthase